MMPFILRRSHLPQQALPQPLLFHHALLLPLLCWAQVATGQTGDDLVGQAVAPMPEDHFLLRLTLDRTSRYEHQGYDAASGGGAYVEGPTHSVSTLRHGPLTFEMRLMPVLGGIRDLGDPGHAEVELTQYLLSLDGSWKDLDIDRQGTKKRLRGAFMKREYGALKKALPELEERLRGIAEHTEDAERLRRLLHGVTTYRWIDVEQPYFGDVAPGGATSVPPAGPIHGHLEGATWESVYSIRGPRGQGSSNAFLALESWSSEDVAERRDVRLSGWLSLKVWRFDEADLERVGELVRDQEELRAALCEWSPKTRAAAEGSHLLAARLQALDRLYCQNFFSGLRRVVEIAWRLAPGDLPSDLFDAEGAPRPDAALRLPELRPGPWFRLTLPERVQSHGAYRSNLVASGTSRGSDVDGKSWNETIEPRVSSHFLNRQEEGRLPIEGLPEGQWADFEAPGAGAPNRSGLLSIHGRGQASGFSGSYNSRWHRRREGHYNAGQFASTPKKSAFAETFEDLLSVSWAAIPGGEPGERPDERIEMRFVRWTEEGFVEIDGPLEFGRPFFVEGRLAAPPLRNVYAVTMESPNGEEQMVFLEPTEEDQTLLRSELLYLMWDLEGDAP